MSKGSVDVNSFSENASNNSRTNDSSTEDQKEGGRKLNIEDLYYNMSGDKYLYIFNHHKYERTKYFWNETPAERRGTFADVMRLERLFKSLNYKVKAYHNLTHEEIIKTVQSDIVKQDHENTACVCVAILTHGDEHGELYAKDRPYKLRDITTMLADSKDMIGIPKLLFIQACRGMRTDAGQIIELDGQSDFIHIPSHIDFLILHSSIEGYVSFKNRNGSWMIQKLCDVIEQYHSEYDILQMMTLVVKKVAFDIDTTSNNPDEPDIHLKKQTPEVLFTLTKFLKFP